MPEKSRNTGSDLLVVPTVVPSFIIKFAPSISVSLIKRLAHFLAFRFQVPCTITPLNFDLHFAYNPQREQYLSTPILAQVKSLTEPSFRAVLTVVKDDLYIPGVNFVFGEAEVGGQVAIISLARLKQIDPQTDLTISSKSSSELFFLRICKEATHELGHVLGLRHCETDQCVMHFAHNINEVDLRSDRFCVDCTQTLAETLYHTNF